MVRESGVWLVELSQAQLALFQQKFVVWWITENFGKSPYEMKTS